MNAFTHDRSQDDDDSAADWQRDAMRTGGIGVWRWDIMADRIDWSEGLEELFGLPPGAFGDTVSSFLTLVHPEDRAAVTEAIERVLGQHGTLRMEYRLPPPQEQRWFETVGQVVLDQAGHPIRVVGSVRDITQRRTVEEALRLSEAKYSTIYHTSPDAIALSRLSDGTYAEVNQSLTKLIGYTSAELIGKSAVELGVWRNPADRFRLVAALRKAGQVVNWEAEFSHKNGTSLFGLLCARVIEVNGEPCMLALTHDITARKRAEETLRDSEETFRTIFEESPYPLSISTPEGRFLNANRAYRERSGYSREELLGRSPSEVGQLRDPADEARLAELFAREGKLDEVEVRSWRRDGSENTVLLSARAVRLGGKPTILSIVQDIGARKRAEEALRASEERFRALIEQGTDLILIIGYDGIIRYESPSVTRVLGHSASKLLKDSIFTQLHPDDVVTARAALAWLATHQEETFRLAVRVRHMDGSWRQIEASGRNILGGPHMEGVIVNARDITERQRAEEQTQRQVRHLNGLRTIDMAITTSTDLRLTLNVILDQVMALLGTAGASVLLTVPPGLTLERGAWRGTGDWSVAGIGWQLAESAIMERRLLHSNPLPAQDVSFGSRLYLAVPLVTKGKPQGVMLVNMAYPFEPSAEWIGLLETLAGQAAIAVDNATLFDELQRSHQNLVHAYDATIEGWSRALDLRDHETVGHTQRVTDMTIRLAREMGPLETDMMYLRWGALLHDIGKMGIPDRILLKPGPLTAEEWTIMQQHPRYAYEMLSPIAFLHPSLDIPYCHHEKWDGTGYPRGLQGEQIPLCARLFAVVDVWDALRSNRVYRAALTEEATRDYLQEQSGRHFEPRAVDAFLRMIGT